MSYTPVIRVTPLGYAAVPAHERSILLLSLTLLALILGLYAEPVCGQAQDTLYARLPEVEITAARATTTYTAAPFSIYILPRSAADAAIEPAFSLESVLNAVPGISVSDRGHFALGERLSIRGMGSRAAFGVRGVQVILDGVPLTMPDGQSVLDIIDPAFIRNVEIIRGPASHFWGNGSGGALFVSTGTPRDRRTFRLRALGGGLGRQSYAVEAEIPSGEHRLHVFASDVRRDGYRNHSAGRFSRGGFRGDVQLSARARLRVTGAVANQDALNPGALTDSERSLDPTLADARYVDSNSGKQSLQFQLGNSILYDTRIGMLTGTVWGLSRRVDSALPFAYIDLDRLAGGLRFMINHDNGPIQWAFGLDAGRQSDNRINYDNDRGEPGTQTRLNQREVVQNKAAFGMIGFPIRPRLRLTMSARADNIRFSMADRLLQNGDQSGHRRFSAASPAVGLSYAWSPSVLIFGDYSTAFETPTTTELVNRPDLTGGFNQALKPQRSNGFELGTRGALQNGRIRFDIAVYHMRVSDRLVPFQTQAGGGRTFYRNEGNSTHDGFEASAVWQPRDWVDLRTSYTGARLAFADDPVRNGNRLPGVPNRHFYGRISVHRKGLSGHVTADARSAYFVNDNNDFRTSGFVVVNMYAGHEGIEWGSFRFNPFMNIDNFFDRRYDGSVIINARGGRYFEPASGRVLSIGINISVAARQRPVH